MAHPTPARSRTLTDEFRLAMRQLATGVVMVTTEVDGQPWGLTVSACCSVSVEPPMLLVSVAERTATAAAVRSTRRFGVSILGEKLLEAARFGSKAGVPKFVSSLCLEPREHGWRVQTPVVSGCLAHIDATLSHELKAGDHMVYVGRVDGILTMDASDPLVYFDGTYHELGPAVGTHLSAPDDAVDSLLYPYPIPLSFRPSVRVPAEKGA